MAGPKRRISKSLEKEFGHKYNLETGLKWERKFSFDDRNHQYQLKIIAVYHNAQNEKSMSKSRDNEFGDKNNKEIDPKLAQFGPNYFVFTCIS